MSAPQWAYERARQIVDEQTKDGWCAAHVPTGAMNAFARYIAAHEDLPATPRDLIAEAVKVGDAYASADRALRLLDDAGFAVVPKGGA